MKIDIKYNKEADEFTNDLTIQMRIERYIENNFYPAYVISKLVPVYLVGGSIRNLINAQKPKDLDFVVIGTENLSWVLSVLNKYNITYKKNRFGGFKFNYNSTEIDLWLTNDLFSSIQYNVDGIFYDLTSRTMISLTFEDYCINGIKLINGDNNIENGREAKLYSFDKTFRIK